VMMAIAIMAVHVVSTAWVDCFSKVSS
jgi:hypothetical protein